MVNLTSSAIEEISIPESTIKYYETKDKAPSAQFEHTVLITDTGCEIMTLSSDGEVTAILAQKHETYFKWHLRI